MLVSYPIELCTTLSSLWALNSGSASHTDLAISDAEISPTLNFRFSSWTAFKDSVSFEVGIFCHKNWIVE